MLQVRPLDAMGIVLPLHLIPEPRLRGQITLVPSLTLEGGEIAVKVGVVPLIDHPDLLPLHLQEGYRRVVAVVHSSDLPQAQPHEGAQENPGGSAVAGGGHSPPRLLRGDLPDAGQHTVPDHVEGLRPLHLPQVGELVEVDQHLTVHPLDLRPRPLLPAAQAHLPQKGQGMERQILGLVYRGGGGLGAEQVAAVHRVDGDVGKAALQCRELPVAAGCDGAVVLPVGNTVEVPLRLRVADQINFSHRPTLPPPAFCPHRRLFVLTPL